MLSASPLAEEQGGPPVLLSLLLSGFWLALVRVVDAFVAVLRDHGTDRLARHRKADDQAMIAPWVRRGMEARDLSRFAR